MLLFIIINIYIYYLSYFSTILVNVEMEIVLPGNMTVIESHDLALALQHKIESLEDIERAFVHVRSFHHTPACRSC